MKLGANVPEAALFLAEFDRSRVAVTGERLVGTWETEALRRCPLGESNPLDGVRTADFGRACGWGADDGEDRPNGLARWGEFFS